MAKGSKKNQERAAAQAKKRARVEKRNNPAPKTESKSSDNAAQNQVKNQVQQRLGDEQYNKVSQSGLQDATKQGSYSANEVISEFRNRDKGVKVDEGENSIVARFKAEQAAGAKFNQKAQDFLSGYGLKFGNQSTNTEKEKVKVKEKEAVKEKQIVNDNSSRTINKTVYADSGSKVTQGSADGSQSFNRTFGDNQNVIGDNNQISGNVNQGNQDFSTNLAGNAKTESSKATAQAFLDSKVDPNKGVTINQSFDREFGDNQNVIGDNNKVYGNVNQGNQDFSVNIGGGSGAAGGRNNMQNAAGYAALNENAYERSNQRFTASGRSQMAIDMAEESNKVGEFTNNVNASSEMMRNFYKNKSNNYMVGMFGDRSAPGYKPPTWVAPKAPGAIKSEYDKDDDE